MDFETLASFANVSKNRGFVGIDRILEEKKWIVITMY